MDSRRSRWVSSRCSPLHPGRAGDNAAADAYLDAHKRELETADVLGLFMHQYREPAAARRAIEGDRSLPAAEKAAQLRDLGQIVAALAREALAVRVGP